jgi:hypothetical protein
MLATAREPASSRIHWRSSAPSRRRERRWMRAKTKIGAASETIIWAPLRLTSVASSIQFLCAHSNDRLRSIVPSVREAPSADSQNGSSGVCPTWGQLYRNGHFGTHFGLKNLRFSGLAAGFKSLLLHHRFPSFCIPLSASAPRRVPMRWKMLQSLIQRNGYRDLCPQVKPEVLAL